MNWIIALVIGGGLGIAYYGSLWLTLGRAMRGSASIRLIRLSRVVRLLLLALGLYVLSQGDGINLLAALIGVLIARWYLMLRLGEIWRGR